MRKRFPGYYVKNDQASLAKLWATARFIFDANMLLNFFRYSPETRDALYKFLSHASMKDRLWVPQQVAQEYHRHLDEVRFEPVAALQALLKQLKDARDRLRADEHRSRVGKLLRDVEGFLADAQTTFDSAEERVWVERIADLYEGRVGKTWTESQIAAVFKEGEERFKRSIPPGFADSAKRGEDRFGDVVVWKQVIEFAKGQGEPVLFITDDAKEDWWLKKGGRTIGPHPMLLDEMAREAPTIPFYIYSGKQFLGYAKLTGVELSDKAIEEVERVRQERELAVESIVGGPTFRENRTVPGGETLDIPRLYLPDERSLLTLDGPSQLVTTLRTANIDRTEGGPVVLNTLRNVEVGRHCWIGLSVRNQGTMEASFTVIVRPA